MPSCVKYFFDKFKWANMESDFVAHWFRHSSCGTYVPKELAAPLYTFEKTGFENRFFMSNIADMLSLVVAAMVLVSLFAMLRLMIPGIQVLRTADNYLRSRMLLTIVMFSYMKVAFLTFLNFSSFTIYSNNAGFNSFFSAAAVVYLIVAPLYYVF